MCIFHLNDYGVYGVSCSVSIYKSYGFYATIYNIWLLLIDCLVVWALIGLVLYCFYCYWDPCNVLKYFRGGNLGYWQLWCGLAYCWLPHCLPISRLRTRIPALLRWVLSPQMWFLRKTASKLIIIIMGRMGICFTSVATSWWGEACCLLLCFPTGTCVLCCT